MPSRSELRHLFSERIRSGGPLVAPGCHDLLSARLAERIGFEAVYFGSYAVAAARLGVPDIGILTSSEMVAYVGAIASAIETPLVADAENGWLEPSNLWWVVKSFETSNIAAIHLEDHDFGKHSRGPQRIAPLEVIQRKIELALAARQDPNFLIIGRSDVILAAGDVEEGIRRVNSFTAAGADLVMLPGLRADVLRQVRGDIKGKVVVAVDPASTADFAAAGADLLLPYALSLLASYDAIARAFAALKIGDHPSLVRISEAQSSFEIFTGFE